MIEIEKDILLKQSMPSIEELELVQGILKQYKHEPWSTAWAATLVYQAGKIAGKREARRNRAPRVEIAFTNDQHKSVSIDLETGRATLRIPKGEQVGQKELELAMDMARASRNRKER